MTIPSLNNLALASNSTFPSETIEPATTPTFGALKVVFTSTMPITASSVLIVIYEGTIVSLRRFKDNVEVVNEGLECGIGLSDYKDIKEGDTIEILAEVEV